MTEIKLYIICQYNAICYDFVINLSLVSGRQEIKTITAEQMLL